MNSTSLLQRWRNPTAEFRGKPFWSWNGRLDKDELLRQLRIFKEMGMGGAFFHSRTGLETEYLGDEWFECINACADEAERLGLEAWLYDEDRWPSGSAGGLATADPAFQMKCLRLTVADSVDAIPEGKRVALFRASLDGLTLGEHERIAEDVSPQLRKDEKLLAFTTETIPANSFYNGNTYLDTLKREATEHFIGLTHEEYRRRCGDRLGRSIKGIFTDEPHHGLVMCHHPDDGDLPAKTSREWTVPWTEALFADFEKRWGYDLRDRLPELFLQKSGERMSPVKWQFMELLQQMFIENWALPCLEWCRAHGMLLTGHVLHEDSMVAQAVPCGSVMRYYEHMDYPGIDILGNDNLKYWVAKQLQSAARQLGKKWLLSELYGCSGWQFDFAGHREIGAWQALLGINLRCHHLSWVTMEGEAKRDYPASISFQSGWHADYHRVEDYFSRIHVLLGEGEPVCHVLWINPIETAWAQIHPGWARWLEAKDSHLRELQQHHDELFQALLSSGVDFDYGDEDHLARLSGIEPVSGGAPRLRVNKMAYRVVLVAGMETLRRSTYDRLREFREAGGTIVCVGPLPTHIEAEPAPELQAFFRGCICAGFDGLPQKLHALDAAAVRMTGGKGKLLAQVRATTGGSICAVLNTDAGQASEVTHFSLPGLAAQIQRWDFLTGNRVSIPCRHEDGRTTWTARLEAGELCAFVTAREADPAVTADPGSPDLPKCEYIDGPLEYVLNEPNCCVLDRAEWQVGDEAWNPAQYFLHIDAQLRERLGFSQRSGTMLQPWARKKQGVIAGSRSVPLRLRFALEVATVPGGAVDLVMEQPEFWAVTVNGRPLGTHTTGEWFIDPCLRRIPLETGWLKPGRNVIELGGDFSESTGIEAIYLTGGFGVSLDNGQAVLGDLPAKLHPRDAASQGLPFYSGAITYRLPLNAAMCASPVLKVETGPFGGALAIVGDDTPVLWAPYHAHVTPDPGSPSLNLTVRLTRANTFGPHHQVPQKQGFIGPDNFRTMGDRFTPEYQLWPAGLLAPPKVHFAAGTR